MIRTAFFTTFLGLACLASPAAAQTQPSPKAMQKMLDDMRPSAEHKELAALAGRWTQDVTYSMGGPPMKTTGTVTNRMILGGRFLVPEGTSANPAGPGLGDPRAPITYQRREKRPMPEPSSCRAKRWMTMLVPGKRASTGRRKPSSR